MANFQLSNMPSVRLDLPEIKAADLSGFTQGFDKLAQIKIASEAQRAKRNKEAAQKLIVQRLQSDPNFASKLYQGQGLGDLWAADPAGAMKIISEKVDQAGQQDLAQKKLDMKTKETKVNNSAINSLNNADPKMFARMRPVWEKVIGPVDNANWELIKADQQTAYENGRKLITERVGNAEIVTKGNKTMKVTDPRPSPRGPLIQQIADADARGDDVEVNRLLGLLKRETEAKVNPYAGVNKVTDTDPTTGISTDRFAPQPKREELVSGGREIPTEVGMTPLEPPPAAAAPGLPSTGMAAPVTPDIAPATASNSIELGPNQFRKPDKSQNDPAAKQEDWIKKQRYQDTADNIKADKMVESSIKQAIAMEAQDAFAAVDEALLKDTTLTPQQKDRALKISGNVRGIGFMYSFMKQLDESVVRPSEFELIKASALGPGFGENKFDQGLAQLKRWWKGQDMTLTPEAERVFKTIQKLKAELSYGQALENITGKAADAIERFGLEDARGLIMSNVGHSALASAAFKAAEQRVKTKVGQVQQDTASPTIDLSKKTGKDWAQLFNGMKTSTMPMGGQ